LKETLPIDDAVYDLGHNLFVIFEFQT
jgi:hypothetical protein